ncbi:helix-turn-helix domain-containing protein [Prevotella sp. HUN102]|uniref:helix-turn-helix domain-containing protein n=1 Tax=Prevotella sp. HUN102 TaxID=1392486 RepID=UPI00048D88E2|nr:helix-turn-helix domain-containing protein [Prevotella sp. HUN102]
MKEINVEFVNANYPTGYKVEKEFLLYDETTKLPYLSESSRLKCLILAFCTKGEITYTVDTVEHTAGPGDVLIISEGQVMGNYKASEDCNGTCLVLSYEFFQEIVTGIRELSALFLFARRHPVFHVDEKLIGQLQAYMRTIKEKISDTNHRFRREMVSSLLKVLIYDMCNIIYRVQQVGTENCTRAEAIFADFIKLVEKEFRHERRVGWYANELNITPKYLSETIKAISQRTPSDWIEYYVMLEIRVLLKNSRMSIKEIAEVMHFPNQSFLGKYFKENYGMSPSQYRRS